MSVKRLCTEIGGGGLSRLCINNQLAGPGREVTFLRPRRWPNRWAEG